MNTLRQDYFHYFENHLALVGERTGITLKLDKKFESKSQNQIQKREKSILNY